MTDAATTAHIDLPPAGTSRPRRRTVRQSDKLSGVLYDIRGPIQDEAARIEARGEQILKLNIGNPAPFGFDARRTSSAAGWSPRKATPTALGQEEQRTARTLRQDPRGALRP